MNALVTGAGGFLGSYLARQLAERGDRVRALLRRPRPDFDALGIETLRGDIRNSDEVMRAAEGVDVVFHVAGVPGIWGPASLYHDVNLQGTRHVIDACRAHQVSRLVYTSSASVVFDGSPHRGSDESLPYASRYLCHYSHSKALAEQAVLAANRDGELRTVSLRPHLIFGAGDNHLVPRVIKRARLGKLRRVGAGDNLISISYVENAAAAHWQVADALATSSPAAGRAYFINEPEPVNLWQWLDQLLAIAGLPPVKSSLSRGVAYATGGLLEAIYSLLRINSEPIMTRFLALQLSTTHYYNATAAERDFGYRPLVDYAEAMRRLEPELKRLAALPL